MKSKKINSNKPNWNSYNKTSSYSNPLHLIENSLVFQSVKETMSDNSMFVDLLAMNNSTNTINSRASQIFSLL